MALRNLGSHPQRPHHQPQMMRDDDDDFVFTPSTHTHTSGSLLDPAKCQNLKVPYFPEANTMGVVSISREKCHAIVPKTTSHLASEL